MTEEYLVKTKKSFYPVLIEGGLLSKKKMKIETPKGEADVRQISEESNMVQAHIKDPESKSVDVANLKPGKIIVFRIGKGSGNTSRIEKVYKKVA
ncbi:hypothetical protein ACFL3V_05335 [Nanoarchaeota archaeon]